MMNSTWQRWAIGFIGIFAFFSVLTVLPRLSARVYLSPDETAVAVSAERFARTGMMRVSDTLLQRFSWMRPRSFVTQGESMVPVGFLGMAFIAGVAFSIGGTWAMDFITPVAVLLSLYPLYRLVRTFRYGARIAVLISWISFPTIILYTNRGLFPNVPVLCAMIWAVYLIREGRGQRAFIFAALLSGLAITIRPVEAPWILVWIVAAYVSQVDTMRCKLSVKWFVSISAAASVFPIVGAYIAWRTYGSPFAVGYWLHDTQALSQTAEVALNTRMSWWPFGFHPRNMLFNIREYIFWYFAPWTTACVMAIALFWRRSREARVFIVSGVLTAIILVCIYGQSIYQDHVGINVISIGNSFLRYILPLTPFVVIAIGGLCDRLYSIRSTRNMQLLVMMSVWTIVSFGTWTALIRDKEGVITDIYELSRYVDIREKAIQLLPQHAVIVSERSDKNFFPQFRAVSPMPSWESLQQIVQSRVVPVYYFGSFVSGKALETWREKQLMLEPVFRSDTQMLYHVLSIENSP